MISREEIENTFNTSKCLLSHVYALLHGRETYLNHLRGSCETGSIIRGNTTGNVRSCVIAALHIGLHYAEMEMILPHCELTDIISAVEALDYRRYMAKVERKIENIEHSNPRLKKRRANSASSSTSSIDSDESDEQLISSLNINNKRKQPDQAAVVVSKYRRVIREREKRLQHNYIFDCIQEDDVVGGEEEGGLSAKARNDETVQKLVESASMSVALSRVIRKWAKNSLSSEYLEYVMLMGNETKEEWKKFASIVRFSPTDFKILYFLSDVYGGLIPKHSFVSEMRELAKFASSCSESTNAKQGMVAEKFISLAEQHPQQVYRAYRFFRNQSCFMSNQEIVNDLAQKMPLNTAIMYFKELCITSPKCEKIITERLQSQGLLVENLNALEHGEENLDQIIARELAKKATPA